MIDFSERRVQRSMGFDPGRSAVLVVDMLNDFLEPTGAMPCRKVIASTSQSGVSSPPLVHTGRQ